MKSLRLNVIFKIILSICNIIIPLLVGPYIIRTLSRTSYDTYTKASVELQLFLTLSSLAVYTYGVREISKIRKNKEETKHLFSELFLIGLLLNVIFAFLYYLYIRYVNNHMGELIYLILMIQFVGNSIYVEWMNEALEDYRFITGKSIFVKILYILTIFVFVKSDNVIAYGFIVSITYVLDSLFSFAYIYYRNGIRLKNLKLKRHVKSLILMFFITNISLLYVQTDKIMLGLLISDSAVATYTIPNYIVTSVYNVVISIIIVAIPRLNDLLCNKSKEDYIKLFNELIRAFCMIFIPILFFVFATSKEIIVVYAAGKYNDCIIPLKAYTVTIFLNSLVFIQREAVLYLYEKENKIILYNFIGGAFNLLSNIILYFTGLFNPLNAIITLAISFLIVNILMRNYVYKKLNNQINFLSKRVYSYFLFSLPIIFVNYLVSFLTNSNILRLLFTTIISVIIYVFLLIITKDKVFIGNVKSTIKKLHSLKKV